MITLERTSGNAYTKDADYAKFSGRVVQTFTTTKYDPKEKCWIKRTVEYIDIGRADEVRANDADTLIDTREEFEPPSIPNYQKALWVNKEKHHRRHVAFQERVCGYLTEFGPMHLRAIARDLEIALNTLQDHLLGREGTVYVRVGRHKNTILWGVIGIHDTKKESA